MEREPLGLVDSKSLKSLKSLRSLDGLVENALPIAMVLLFLLSLALVVQRAGVLRSWSQDYAGSGDFLVESCGERAGLGADQWTCTGLLKTGDGSGVGTELVTSRGALVSDRPYVGERLEVFHATGDDSVVYPVSYRLNELARVFLSLLPRLLLAAGSLIWLAGWYLTRNLDPDDFVTRDAMRLPQRFSWRSTGVTWIVCALALVVANYLLTTRVLGSLGIA